MRLDRFLSNSTGMSRNDARQVIRRGLVAVDGTIVKKLDTPVGEANVVTFQDEAIAPPGLLYLMMNKPEGVVCSTRDREHQTVIDLIDDPRALQLHPVGRLDIGSTGMVLLTDDGKWSHGITSPRRHQAKRYRVRLAEPVAADASSRFSQGMMLNEEKKPTLPAELTVIDEQEVLVTLHEGRYHQIKRMFAAVGNHVTALHREAIGTVELDPELAPGECRFLTEDEVKALSHD